MDYDPNFRLTRKQLAEMKDYLKTKITEIPSYISTKLISDHAAENRIMPRNTPRPGPWDNDYTPYLMEPMNNMSPGSEIQHTIILKAAQGGFTAMAENVVCYFMSEYPADILFISASERLLERWAIRRIEPAIDSYGIRKHIYAQSELKHSRRTGDKTFSKEYHGCCLDMASAQSPGQLRSTDKRILIRDEIDGAPATLRTKEGNWLDVSYVRTNAWGARRKVLDFSTPHTFEESQIWPLYERGDQRHFLIPCPYCNKFQELKLGDDKTQYGLKPETKEGKLIDVYYMCEHCRGAIRNHHKTEFLIKGKWEPTSISESKFIRSYYWNSLYSPPNMLTWLELYREYLAKMETADGMKAFTNLYLGMPYRETGSRPKLDKVIELRGGYKSNTVPEKVLFLTAGIDVQRGSARDSVSNPARLEMEVCGHGLGYRTWSILYRRFLGDVMDPYDGAWLELSEWAKETGFRFKRKDGFEFPVMVVFIDSGDGNVTDIVYRFSQQWESTFPSKGFGALKRQKAEKEKGDEAGPSNFRRYRAVKVGEGIQLYEISTNYYKTFIYNNLQIPRQDADRQKPGFCDFPVDYGERYFKELTAEEKRTDGSFHCPSGRRNEALDCRVMNLCAGDVFLDSEVMRFKAAAQAKGAKPSQLQGIGHRIVLDYLTKVTGLQKVID